MKNGARDVEFIFEVETIFLSIIDTVQSPKLEGFGWPDERPFLPAVVVIAYLLTLLHFVGKAYAPQRVVPKRCIRSLSVMY